MIRLEKWQHRRFERGTRYYILALQQDLWGNWEVVRVNGRIGTRLGRITYDPCSSYQNALAHYVQLAYYRQKYRKYRVITCNNLVIN